MESPEPAAFRPELLDHLPFPIVLASFLVDHLPQGLNLRQPACFGQACQVRPNLKTKRLTHADLVDFVRCYHERQETERFRRFSYDELIQRDKLNLDIFWLAETQRENGAGVLAGVCLAQDKDIGFYYFEIKNIIYILCWNISWERQM